MTARAFFNPYRPPSQSPQVALSCHFSLSLKFAGRSPCAIIAAQTRRRGETMQSCPKSRRAAAAILASFLVSWFPAVAAAQFFKGKEIQFLISHPAGGGYDTYARLYTRHLRCHEQGAGLGHR